MLIADRVAGLGRLTVQAHCLSGHSHYPPPQLPAQLSLNEGAILWLTLENGKEAGTRNLERYSYMYSDKSSLVLIVYDV